MRNLNSILIVFQMMVEEVKKAKELAAQPKPKSGDDEPDWQNVSFVFVAFVVVVVTFVLLLQKLGVHNL